MKIIASYHTDDDRNEIIEVEQEFNMNLFEDPEAVEAIYDVVELYRDDYMQIDQIGDDDELEFCFSNGCSREDERDFCVDVRDFLEDVRIALEDIENDRKNSVKV